MDKMLIDSMGSVTIANDGATILKEMDVPHPAAKMMVEIAKAVDDEVGDGTTSSVIIAGAMLEKAEELVMQGIHPTIIVDGYRKAMKQAMEIEHRELLADDNHFMAVDLDNVKVQKKPGGAMRDSSLVRGIIIDKEMGHSEMPKKIIDAKVLPLNSSLEIEKTEFEAKISIDRPNQMKMFLEEETRMIKTMVEKIVQSGANIVVCQKGIDDVALEYLTKANISAIEGKGTGCKRPGKSDRRKSSLKSRRSIFRRHWICWTC